MPKKVQKSRVGAITVKNVLMVMILICLGVLNYFTDNDDDGGVLI